MLDLDHVMALKNEIMTNAGSTFTLTVNLPYVPVGEFRESSMGEYYLEVIGGNHSKYSVQGEFLLEALRSR